MAGIAIIAFTRAGCSLACTLAEGLAALPSYAAATFTVSGPARFARGLGISAYGSLAAWTAEHFAQDDALIFVGASGIAVRAVAPHVHDKFSDPAVVSADEAGRFAVPLLSGHVGGANDLARAVAVITGGQAAVSTATDVNGMFAVDEWAARHGCAIVERSLAKEVSAALLEGRPVGFASDFQFDEIPAGFDGNATELGFLVSLDDAPTPFARTLHLVPRAVTVGVGCRRGIDPALLEQAVSSALHDARVSLAAVSAIASIDVKADEEALHALAGAQGWELKFYTAVELAAVSGEFESSAFVERTVGVDNVCERAACADGGTLLLGKQARDGVTVAVALQPHWAERLLR